MGTTGLGKTLSTNTLLLGRTNTFDCRSDILSRGLTVGSCIRPMVDDCRLVQALLLFGEQGLNNRSSGSGRVTVSLRYIGKCKVLEFSFETNECPGSVCCD